jgi:hypothetical protein
MNKLTSFVGEFNLVNLINKETNNRIESFVKKEVFLLSILIILIQFERFV